MSRKDFGYAAHRARPQFFVSRSRKTCECVRNAAIIFTTNNDSYLYRRYVNKNGEKVQDSMLRMAKKYNAGVWDMFSVMGGLNSIVLWQNNGLARSDKIHFTREGYLMIGDLFFGAMMKDFENFLTHKKELTTNNNFEEKGEERSFERPISQSLDSSK